MRQFIAGCLVGGLVGAGLATETLRAMYGAEIRSAKYDGHADGLIDAAHAIGHSFGDYDRTEGQYQHVYTIKDVDVVAVTVNGVKTIRVLP